MTIGNGVELINASAFQDCNNLLDLIVEKNVTTI